MRLSSLFRYSLFLLLFVPTLQGQNDKALLHELALENQKSVDALALYPSETRLAIFEAAKYPEVLIKMNNARQKTAAAFRTLIEDFPRADQTVFYNIASYPGMLRQLVENQESPAAIRDLLKQLPENERTETYNVVQNQPRTLLKINELDLTARTAFEDLIVEYPATAQAAFRQLVELPEVLEILNEDLRFTVLVGDVYRSDPVWVIEKTDSLNLAVARAHAEELDEWKKDIESDPVAQQELESASQAYAQEYGYETQAYSGDDLYYDDYYTQRNIYTTYHYPWWFGYPWWYPAPYWQPYPSWYDWGFYHQQHFTVVYMPSWHFMNWYFDHPNHHYQYSHLSSHFVSHYYGHRRSGTSISTGVGEWYDRNRSVISEDFIKDNGRLPERMKEYGRFEENREQYNGRNPKNPVSREAFLDKTPAKYPDLKKSKMQAATEINRDRETQQTQSSPWAPRKEPVPAVPKTQPSREIKPQPTPQMERPPRVPSTVPADTRSKPQPTPTRTEQPRVDPPRNLPVEKANEYHKQQWEATKNQEIQRTRQPAPAPRVQPQRSIAPQQSTTPQRTTTPQRSTAPQTKKEKARGN